MKLINLSTMPKNLSILDSISQKRKEEEEKKLVSDFGNDVLAMISQSDTPKELKDAHLKLTERYKEKNLPVKEQAFWFNKVMETQASMRQNEIQDSTLKKQDTIFNQGQEDRQQTKSDDAILAKLNNLKQFGSDGKVSSYGDPAVYETPVSEESLLGSLSNKGRTQYDDRQNIVKQRAVDEEDRKYNREFEEKKFDYTKSRDSASNAIERQRLDVMRDNKANAIAQSQTVAEQKKRSEAIKYATDRLKTDAENGIEYTQEERKGKGMEYVKEYLSTFEGEDMGGSAQQAANPEQSYLKSLLNKIKTKEMVPANAAAGGSNAPVLAPPQEKITPIADLGGKKIGRSTRGYVVDDGSGWRPPSTDEEKMIMIMAQKGQMGQTPGWQYETKYPNQPVQSGANTSGRR